MQEAKGRERTKKAKQGQPKSTNQKTTNTKPKPKHHHFPLQQVKQVKQVRRKLHQVENSWSRTAARKQTFFTRENGITLTNR